MAPAAPPTLSTTTVPCRRAASASPTTRAARSTEPPAGYPTTSFKGLAGKLPWAAAGKASPSAAAPRRLRRLRTWRASEERGDAVRMVAIAGEVVKGIRCGRGASGGGQKAPGQLHPVGGGQRQDAVVEVVAGVVDHAAARAMRVAHAVAHDQIAAR